MGGGHGALAFSAFRVPTPKLVRLLRSKMGLRGSVGLHPVCIGFRAWSIVASVAAVGAAMF